MIIGQPIRLGGFQATLCVRSLVVPPGSKPSEIRLFFFFFFGTEPNFWDCGLHTR